MDAALGSAIVALIRELRPDLPTPVARSLAVETVDQARADMAWAERRPTTDPHVLAAATNRHAGHPYSERRAAELCTAVHSPGDYRGRA